MKTLSIAVLALLGKVSAENLGGHRSHKLITNEGDPAWY